MQVTETLCQTLMQTTYDTLPVAVVEVAKQVILDGIAVAVAGSTQEGPRLMAAHLRELGGTAASTVLGMGFKTSAVAAACINGLAMHVLDYEPMWSPPTHATSPTLPVVLALAETEELSGREVITAFVKGCELQGRIRLASKQYAPGQLTYHPPGIVGVMGAAVAAAHMLALDAESLRNALGLAASRTGGLMANVGTMTKASHCGMAAAAGLDAALLARRGFTANPNIFEAPNGYIDAFFGAAFDVAAFLDYGRPYRLVDPGFAIKMFPSQYATHFGITAALDLHAALADASDIAAVHLATPLMPYVDRPLPQTGLDGKFSFQYTAAAALLDGTVHIRTFTDARRFKSDMVDLLPKVRVVQSTQIPAELENMWVDMEVELHSGRRLATTCRGPRGFWGLPRLQREDHLVKIRDCLGTHLTPEDTARCIHLVDSLERLGPAEVRELVALAA